MAALAPSRFQHDVHPLLRHPKPIKRDFAKAQRMLGLVADNEEHLKQLQREKSVTTRWLERPLYQYLDMSDMESDMEEAESKVKAEPELAQDGATLVTSADISCRPDQANQTSYVPSEASTTINSKTSLATSTRRRPVLVARPRLQSHNTQQLLTPELCASPSTLSPDTQRPRPLSMPPKSPTIEKRRLSSNVNNDATQRTIYSDSWIDTQTEHRTSKRTERAMSFQPPTSSSRTNLTVNEPRSRPRPSSFATYSQPRNRSNSKIASSRGLRNNSYPNFSRPISGIAPKIVPGEEMEKDTICSHVADGTTGPLTSSPSPCHVVHGLEPDDDDQNKVERKSRHRWSAIPGTFKKLTKRRPSAAAYESPDPEIKIEALRRVNLTEENLPWQRRDHNQTMLTPESRFSGPALLPTPTTSPLDINHPLFESPLPLPFAPWANGPPSPATSMDKVHASPVSPLSPTRKNAPSQLSAESLVKFRPTSLHSAGSSAVSPLTSSPRTPTRGATPSLERTCILCKTSKPPTGFITGRITANCWHEPATCVDCLQDWIETFFDIQGSDRCPCPECGESMTYEDIGAFTDVTNL